MAAKTIRKSGRPSKGDRKFIGFRLATGRADILTEVAAKQGIPVSDLVAELVDKGINSLDLSAIERQEELDLKLMAS